MENLNERTATELFEVIYLMPKDDINKLPSDFLDILHKKKSKLWKIYSSPSEINTKNLSEDTKNYLAYIYLNYILDDEEKKNYKIILEENEKNYQKEISEVHNNKINNKNIKHKENVSKDLTVKNEKSIFKKFLNKIKEFIKRLHK